MVCAELGIAECEFTNGAAYIASWLETLRSDRKEIFRAAADAQRIADYLLALHPEYALAISPRRSPRKKRRQQEASRKPIAASLHNKGRERNNRAGMPAGATPRKGQAGRLSAPLRGAPPAGGARGNPARGVPHAAQHDDRQMERR